MDKLIRANDIIVVDESVSFKAFDVIVFYYNDVLFCHRCMLNFKHRAIEFGENSKSPKWISKEKMVGRCIGIIRDHVFYKWGDFSRQYYALLWMILVLKVLFFKLHLIYGGHYAKIISKLNSRLWIHQCNYLLPEHFMKYE
jgi:hypothetical protein